MGKLSKVKNGGIERGKQDDQGRRRGGVFIPPSHKNGHYNVPGRIIWPKLAKISGGRIIRPKLAKKSGPPSG
jgi:hypothetical protein